MTNKELASQIIANIGGVRVGRKRPLWGRAERANISRMKKANTSLSSEFQSTDGVILSPLDCPKIQTL